MADISIFSFQCIRLLQLDSCSSDCIGVLLTCICYLVQVILTLEEPEVGLTVVKLTQTNVPDEDRYVNIITFVSFLDKIVLH